MSMRKLRRTPHDKMVAGVCGGIAEYFGIDATLVRVAYVVLSVISTGFPGLLVYIILAFVMPEN
jgi:phage shock protein C